MHLALQTETEQAFPLKSIFEVSLFEQHPAPASLKSTDFLAGFMGVIVRELIEVRELLDDDESEVLFQLNEQLLLR
ncbi:MAG: hypothetical protein CL913_00020 [Deltaproteobacteria bacterium]|nr:hypothetical protein [Deltaproteobacteria bacterium]